MTLSCFPACVVLLATVTSLCAATARAQDVAPSPAASPSPVVIPDIPSALSPLSPLSPQCTPGSTCPLSGGTPGNYPPPAGGVSPLSREASSSTAKPTWHCLRRCRSQ